MDKDLEKFLNGILNDGPIDDALNEMLTETKNKVIEEEKETRHELINLLKAERTSLLMKNKIEDVLKDADNGKSLKKYEKTINLATKMTKLIDLMTIETLREDGA